MALLRCPQCQAPITAEETGKGSCPLCAAPIKPQSAPATKTSQAAAPVAHSSPGSIVWAMVGTVAFCFVLFGILLHILLPDRQASKENETAKTQDEAFRSAKVDPKKTSTAEPAPKKLSKDEAAKKQEPEETALPIPKDKQLAKEPPEPIKQLPKQEEPKKKELPNPVEVKKEEPKKVEDPKVAVEPKKQVPEPMPDDDNRLANWNLPLLSNEAITIDGDLSDWKGIAPLFLNKIERGRPTNKVVASPKTQKAYIAYCPKGILVAVDIVDTSGKLENVGKPDRGMWAFWDNDAIEIYIDTLNLRPDRRGHPSAHQFFAFPFGTPGDQGIGGYESRILANEGERESWSIVPLANTGKDGMLRAGKKTAAGWTMEMLIPKSALRKAELRPGRIIGLEIQIDTGTNIYYFWANDNPDLRVSTHPSAWGEVLLAGTDGIIELLDSTGKPAKTFTPGQPLTIRVTDADVNLDPDKKEKLQVTLIGKTNGEKTLVLQETEPNSGVFTGTVPTQFRTEKRVEGTIELTRGESIVVEYLDRLRANGARRVTLRSEFAPAPSKQP